MDRIKAQKNDEKQSTAEVFSPGFPIDYGTECEAAEAMQIAADDYAATWAADTYHNMELGLSTVYFDDGQYTCFWFSDIGE